MEFLLFVVIPFLVGFGAVIVGVGAGVLVCKHYKVI